MYYKSITAAEPRPFYSVFAIPGFDNYFVDVTGTVWSDKSGAFKPMKPKVKRNGYLEVCLRQNGEQTYHYVHALVLTVFHGPRPEGMISCHGPDHTKANCQIGNLRWDTPKANTADYIASGKAHGRDAGRPKFVSNQIRTIRRAHARGTSI